MTIWKTIRVVLERLRYRIPEAPCRIAIVDIKWPAHPDPKMHFPSRLEVPVGRRGIRCVTVRKDICSWLGTAWVWTGPRTISVLARYQRIPPKGGSGTAPPKAMRDTMAGSNGTDYLHDLQRYADMERRRRVVCPPLGLLAWAAGEIERLRGERDDLRMALEAAQIPQVRVDPPHEVPRGPHG